MIYQLDCSYSKMVRSKDLSKLSTQDWGCIFGKKEEPDIWSTQLNELPVVKTEIEEDPVNEQVKKKKKKKKRSRDREEEKTEGDVCMDEAI